MKNQPNLAYQRKRPRYKSGNRPGISAPGGSRDAAGDARDSEDNDTPSTMEARTQEAEAAYHFSGQETDEPAPPTAHASSPAPAERHETSAPEAPENDAAADNGDGAAPPQDPAALRREQERMRRDQERDRRENERKERERRENERRDQQKKEQERRERERVMELRSLDVDSICSKAWEIYSAEVKEEGVELIPDNDARELCKRSFRLAEIFLLEDARLRKLRSEPVPESAPEAPAANPESATEQTIGE